MYIKNEHWPALNLIWEYQNEHCALCPETLMVVLDHDHETGWIRGYLCRSCNYYEARPDKQDDPKFALYRQLSPAAMLGIRIRYPYHKS